MKVKVKVKQVMNLKHKVENRYIHAYKYEQPLAGFALCSLVYEAAATITTIIISNSR